MSGIIKESPTSAEWRPYPDRVRSSHWYELFLSSPNDARQGLTWKGLFRDVDNTINFYSSADYSKILGPMSIEGSLYLTSLIFNPRPNDSKLEFDQDNNLVTDNPGNWYP